MIAGTCYETLKEHSRNLQLFASRLFLVADQGKTNDHLSHCICTLADELSCPDLTAPVPLTVVVALEGAQI